MEKSRAIELLEHLAWDKDNEGNCYGEALQMAIDSLKAQLSQEGTTKGTTSDLISRQQALDIFDDYNVSVENGELEAYSRDRKRLCELPTIQPEPQWIPVSERLPEKGGEYLVSVHHTIGAISVFHPEKDTYVDDVAIMKYYGKFPSTVRAWMPLPEAYKGG